MQKVLRYKKAILFILFLTAWVIFLALIDVEKIISEIGVNNGYLIAFFVALFGGASSFTSSSYITTIIALALAGLNPFLLAITGGVALAIGDSIFYFLSKKSRDNFPKGLDKKITKLTRWISHRSINGVRLATYIYTGFTPFPADILMVALSFSKIKFKDVLLFIILGNMTFILIVYYLAVKGISIFA